MRYTKDDYQNVLAILTGHGASAARLAPQERRALDQVRIAYVMRADVQDDEARTVRAIVAAAHRTPQPPPNRRP